VTGAANSKGDVGANGGKRQNPISPYGTNRKDDKNIHAEEKVIPPGGGEAVGAGRAHCANCTNDIINSGNVPATSIDPSWNPTPGQLKPKTPGVQW
jgi:hypothetical protein